MRAAALLRRPDIVELAAPFTVEVGPLGEWWSKLDENLRQRIGSDSLELPKVKDEVMSWAATEVAVSIKPGHKKNFRLVEIAYGESKFLTAGARRNASQRAALELIEQASAAKRQGDEATT